jgi:flagellar motor switch protein FliG
MAQDGAALARIDIARVPASSLVAVADMSQDIPPKAKAAIIVRFLQSQGQNLPLNKLSDQLQANLAEQMGSMRLVDRATMMRVIVEFLDELDQVGLTFPGGVEAALASMDGHISAGAATRLRRKAGANTKGDPWDRLIAVPAERILPLLETESVEVAAVTLSKMPVPKAADLLSRMPGERARRVAFAISLTAKVDPETVRRIGVSLASQLDAEPPRAFDGDPVERVGAILNVANQVTRDDVMEGLQSADQAFANQVRKAIFTFVHLPHRLSPRDVPKLVRQADPAQLVTAMAAAFARPDLSYVAEFLLANMSQRMSQSLREEATARGKVKDKDAEEATSGVINAVRALEASGEVQLIQEEE